MSQHRDPAPTCALVTGGVMMERLSWVDVSAEGWPMLRPINCVGSIHSFLRVLDYRGWFASCICIHVVS